MNENNYNHIRDFLRSQLIETCNLKEIDEQGNPVPTKGFLFPHSKVFHAKKAEYEEITNDRTGKNIQLPITQKD